MELQSIRCPNVDLSTIMHRPLAWSVATVQVVTHQQGTTTTIGQISTTCRVEVLLCPRGMGRPPTCMSPHLRDLMMFTVCTVEPLVVTIDLQATDEQVEPQSMTRSMQALQSHYSVPTCINQAKQESTESNLRSSSRLSKRLSLLSARWSQLR